jgi:hypothetical protein
MRWCALLSHVDSSSTKTSTRPHAQTDSPSPKKERTDRRLPTHRGVIKPGTDLYLVRWVLYATQRNEAASDKAREGPPSKWNRIVLGRPAGGRYRRVVGRSTTKKAVWKVIWKTEAIARRSGSGLGESFRTKSDK